MEGGPAVEYTKAASCPYIWLYPLPRQHIRVVEGIHHFYEPSEDPLVRWHDPLVSVGAVTYGDLGSDSTEEAAVQLNYSTGGTTIGISCTFTRSLAAKQNFSLSSEAVQEVTADSGGWRFRTVSWPWILTTLIDETETAVQTGTSEYDSAGKRTTLLKRALANVGTGTCEKIEERLLRE